MTDHLNIFQGIMNQLSAMGINFDEEIQGLFLLGSLPDSWEIIRTSLSNSAPNEKCEHCLAGKQNRVSFKSHLPSRKTELLELVHSHLWSNEDEDCGGALYFATFIDDCSRKLWVYVLKTKDQVLGVFKQFQASVERETGKKLKCIRTDNGKENFVCKLKKSLYGLKQAPDKGYKKFESQDGEQGYKKTSSDHCVFVQRFSHDDDFIILLLYVDDMLIVGKNASRIGELKKQLSKSFAMKDLGHAKQILGMSITRSRDEKKLYLSQKKYIERVLERFNMKNAKRVSTPLPGHLKLSKKMCPTTTEEKERMAKIPYSSAVGSLMYAMVCTRPDIAHAVGVVSRFLENPGKEHWEGCEVDTRFWHWYTLERLVLYVVCVDPSNPQLILLVLNIPPLFSYCCSIPQVQDAVDEVVDKVLARPIRPQFVIASIGPSFCLEEAHCLITGRFGCQIPVITSTSHRIFGQDANTNEFEEVQWDTFEDNDAHDDLVDEDKGVLITVGLLPGLTVDLIPLKKSRGLMTKDFMRSIRECSFSRSGSPPIGILLFSDEDIDIKPVLAKLDYAFSSETAIVGNGGSKFFYRGGTAINRSNNKASSSAAVALSFSRDIGKPPGVGETQFHVMLSTGISPIGPTYKAVYVKAMMPREYSTQLMGTTEDIDMNLDGDTLLDQIYDELGYHTHSQALYVGVTPRRKCTSQRDHPSWITMHEFHVVLRGEYEDLSVHGDGIRNYDSFRFYHRNSDLAHASCNNVSNNLRSLKQDLNHLTHDHTNSNDIDMHKKSVFGGMMFADYGRGKLLFGEPNVDASPFLENFPGVTFSGTYCNGEIAHGDLSSYEDRSKEHSYVRCSFYENSTVYLVMSYTPALPQH
ncbi:F-box/LRR-repeat protein At5g63520-like [Lycium ferocissimum]|uniref:F-box/LRR-repeat protein At5g63520-like n=1 Tax=Lycium ferocissimum TaxID=112874 RepID=UPI0028163626|nr:F-box/LRR-repeat protein At5g63520-like [Lycium ferocissimum]